jgi:DeoR family transcriptional regulator of aga operon
MTAVSEALELVLRDLAAHGSVIGGEGQVDGSARSYTRHVIPRAIRWGKNARSRTQTSFALEKRAIGQAAAQLIHNGETVLLDVGTTAVAAARAPARRTDVREVAVFTNGVKTALELEAAIPRLNVILLGGTVEQQGHSAFAGMRRSGEGRA